MLTGCRYLASLWLLLTHWGTTALALMLLVSNVQAQNKERPSDFEAKGRVVDPKGMAVRADVVLLKVSVHTQQLTVVGRQKCNEKGQFTIRCPLNAHELKLLVMPTDSTAADLFLFSRPHGLEPNRECC